MLIESVPGLAVRSGSDADQPLVNQICAEIWGGEDYVPYLWKLWGESSENQRYILELDGQAVGVYCLRLGIASPTSSWVQAVRVEPAVRKRGIGAGLLEHAIRVSCDQKMTELRYATASDNTPMHRLAARFGFHQIGTYLMQECTADLRQESAQPGSAVANAAGSTGQRSPISGLRTVQPTEIEAVWNLITTSPEHLAAHQFYCHNWYWMILTRERLASHLAKKEFYTFDEPATLRSLVFRAYYLDEPANSPPQPVYRLAGIYGDPAARVGLLQALGQEIAALTPPEMTVCYDCQLPQNPATEQALQATGFSPAKHEPVMFLFEKTL